MEGYILQVGILFAVGVLGVMIRYSVPAYVAEKAKNLASKQDIAEITQRVEAVKTAQAVVQSQMIRYSEAHFERISRLWSALQDLRRTGDSLWEKADPAVLVQFSKSLSNASLELDKASIFIDDEDHQALKQLLTRFGNFHVGKRRLIQLRTTDNVLTAYRDYGTGSISHMIEEQIKHNWSAKAEYEELLVSFGRRLREKLKLPTYPG